MYKNKIVELFDINSKTILYNALEQNKNIMYTKNERAAPLRTKSRVENIYTTEYNNRNYILVIEPDKMQLEYFEFNILPIEKIIELEIDIEDLQKFYKKNSKEKFIDAMESSQFEFLCQYDSNTIYEYIGNITE